MKLCKNNIILKEIFSIKKIAKQIFSLLYPQIRNRSYRWNKIIKEYTIYFLPISGLLNKIDKKRTEFNFIL